MCRLTLPKRTLKHPVYGSTDAIRQRRSEDGGGGSPLSRAVVVYVVSVNEHCSRDSAHTHTYTHTHDHKHTNTANKDPSSSSSSSRSRRHQVYGGGLEGGAKKALNLPSADGRRGGAWRSGVKKTKRASFRKPCGTPPRETVQHAAALPRDDAKTVRPCTTGTLFIIYVYAYNSSSMPACVFVCVYIF